MDSAQKNTQVPQMRKSVGKTCKIHGPYTAQITDYNGRKMYSACPKCVEKYDNRLDDDKKEKILSMLQDSRIPKRFLPCKIENYQTIGHPGKQKAAARSKAYVDTFDERKKYGSSLVLCGVPGTGKTHLACAVAIDLIKKGHQAFYTTTYEALMSIKATYGGRSEITEKQILNKLQNIELLILDEVGVQFGTDTEKIIFYQIINGRYENVLPTILISNLPENELAEYVGERCMDRLREGGGAVIAFDWESYRTKKNEKGGK